MKIRLFIVLLLAALLPWGVQAAGRAQEILQGLAVHVRSLGSYEVEFSVDIEGRPAAGFYAVGGDRYYIRMGGAEVFGEGNVRYEVNGQTREVVVDKVDASNRSVLNNPTQAFDLVGDEFAAELLWERNGQAAVRLTPRQERAVMSAVTVTVDTQRMEPRSLTYDFDGDQITIGVLRMTGGKGAPKTFDRAAYGAYEFIDFR